MDKLYKKFDYKFKNNQINQTNQKMTITTIDSLLRGVWRYESEILKLIFEFYSFQFTKT